MQKGRRMSQSVWYLVVLETSGSERLKHCVGNGSVRPAGGAAHYYIRYGGSEVPTGATECETLSEGLKQMHIWEKEITSVWQFKRIHSLQIKTCVSGHEQHNQ